MNSTRCALVVLSLTGLAGCSLILDGGQYVGGGEGKVDGGTDAGPSPCEGKVCAPGEACDPSSGMCRSEACASVAGRPCMDDACCDCDQDGYLRAGGGCIVPGSGALPDCDDFNPRVHPFAAPDCTTPGPDHCDDPISANISARMADFGYSEAGMIPYHELWVDGAPFAVQGDPQVSVARLSASETEVDGFVSLITDDPDSGAESRVLVVPYNTINGFFPGQDLGDLAPALGYGSARAAAVTEDGKGMGVLVDQTRLALLTPSLGGFTFNNEFNTDPDLMPPLWPIAVGFVPRVGGTFVAYHRGREIRAFTSEGSLWDAPYPVDSLFPPRVGGDLIVTAGDPLDMIHLWQVGGSLATRVGLAASVVGQLDVTRIPSGPEETGEYAIVVPVRDAGGGGPFIRTVHANCDPSSDCRTAYRDSFPGWGVGTRVAIGALAGSSAGAERLLLAAIGRPSEEPDGLGGEELSLYFMNPDGEPYPADGRGQDPGGIFRLPLIQPSNLSGDFVDPVVRSLDSATVANERGDVDFMVAAGITPRGDNKSRIYLMGARFCAP